MTCVFISYSITFSLNENWLLKNNIWHILYKTSCYDESEIIGLIPNILATLFITISSYYSLTKWFLYRL